MTDLEAAVLTFAEQQWKYAGAREAAIRDEFGWTAVRYHQVLNGLLDRPDVEAVNPQLVRRLRRLRDARRKARTSRAGM